VLGVVLLTVLTVEDLVELGAADAPAADPATTAAAAMPTTRTRRRAPPVRKGKNAPTDELADRATAHLTDVRHTK
jgi:hypothetical protein